jgi:hypothetical protein
MGSEVRILSLRPNKVSTLRTVSFGGSREIARVRRAWIDWLVPQVLSKIEHLRLRLRVNETVG